LPPTDRIFLRVLDFLGGVTIKELAVRISIKDENASYQQFMDSLGEYKSSIGSASKTMDSFKKLSIWTSSMDHIKTKFTSSELRAISSEILSVLAEGLKSKNNLESQSQLFIIQRSILLLHQIVKDNRPTNKLGPYSIDFIKQ